MTITPIQSTERAPVIASFNPQANPSTPAVEASISSAYYFSPVLKIDQATQAVVIEYRNSQTGAVTNQFPSEKDLKAYAAQQKLSEVQQEQSLAKTSAEASTENHPAPTAVVSAAAVKPTATTADTSSLPDSATTASQANSIVT